MIKRNLTIYRPWWPDIKIIRTRGTVYQTALVVFWFGWILEIEWKNSQK